MLKKILTVILFFSTLISFSQEMIKEFDLKLNRKRDFFQVVNKEKNEIIIFSNDKEKVSSFRFDDKFNIQDSLSATRPENTYKEILGYSQKDNVYCMFWGSKDRKKISSQFFDFNTKETGIKTFELELKKEKIFKEITVNNVFYLITIIKNTGDLKFYIFENNNLSTKTVDLSRFTFSNSSGNPVNLHTALTEDLSGFFIQNISNESSPSLALSSKQFKLYTYKNDEIIFTIDINSYSTDVLRINLKNFTADVKSINQPIIARGEYNSLTFKTNSFLIDDKLLQIKTNPEVLFLTISDLDGNLINEFKALREEEIEFKNSDTYEEKGDGFYNKKLLEKPKQFIRKINNSNPSVSCYKLNNLYYTVIGSSKDIVRSSGMGPGFGGAGFGGAGFGTTASFGFSLNYTVENLISYRDKIVVYTNCLFDSNFNHVKEEIKPSAFDKARMFLEETDEIKKGNSVFKPTSIYNDLIIFKFKSSLYLGNYNNDNKKYQIFSFTE